MRNASYRLWFLPPATAFAALITLGAYMARESSEAAPPVLPQSGLRVELIKTPVDFVETLVSGDDMIGCDVNGDGHCDGADIQPYVAAMIAD